MPSSLGRSGVLNLISVPTAAAEAVAIPSPTTAPAITQGPELVWMRPVTSTQMTLSAGLNARPARANPPRPKMQPRDVGSAGVSEPAWLDADPLPRQAPLGALGRSVSDRPRRHIGGCDPSPSTGL